MAGIFFDSFDHLAYGDLTEKWTQLVAVISGVDDGAVGTSYGRNGTKGLRLKNTLASSASRALLLTPFTPAPSGATFIGGVAINPHTPFAALQPWSTEADAPVLMRVRDTGTTQVWLRMNTNGTLSVLKGSTVILTSAGALVQDVWQYVELKVVLNTVTGSAEIRLNGVSVGTVTNVNTCGAGSSVWTDFGVGPAYATSAGIPEWWIDDVYCCDGSGSANNTFLGDIRIDALIATGAGATTGWTPSTGANWSCVDEKPPNDDTDYVSTGTVDAKDTYVIEDAPTSANIVAVQANMLSRKADAGSAQLAAVTRISGTDYAGPGRGMTTTYSDIRQIWDRNPADSSVWTAVIFNAAQFGIQKTA